MTKVKITMGSSSTRSAFPDKERPSSSHGWCISSPSARLGGRLPYGRLGNSSSSEECLGSLREMPSCGSGTDSCNSTKIFVYTPRSPEGRARSFDRSTHDALLRLTQDTETDVNRPHSPRPCNSGQSLLEHNKQLHIWDDWSSSAFQSSEADVASVKYKRTPSENLSKKLPRKLDSQLSDELDTEMVQGSSK